MSTIIPIEVQLPTDDPEYVDTLRYTLQQYAQDLIDTPSTIQPKYFMTTEEIEKNSITVEESERRLTKLIHDFYDKKKEV